MAYTNPIKSSGPQDGKTSPKAGSKPSGYSNVVNASDKGDRPKAKLASGGPSNGYSTGGLSDDTSFSGHGKKSKGD